MPKTVAALFERTLLAEDAIQKLSNAGFERNDISLVAQNASGDYAGIAGGNLADRVDGAGAGAAIGGVAGALAGLVALAIPGIGPVLAAGPLAFALGGAGLGAAAGGLIGALTGLHIPEDDAHYYADSIRRGGALVIVKTGDDTATRASEILNQCGATSPAKSEQEIEDGELAQTNRPDTPQMPRTGARVYIDGLEMDPRKSRFEEFK